MNEETFLLALHENPSDEVTWLALADWLEEDGQGDRAELVRLTRHLRTLPVMKRSKQRVAMEARLTELLNTGVRPVVPQIVNSIGMRFSLIPPGRFRMGSPLGEQQRYTSETAHEVELTRPFYLGVFSVTQGQYLAVMGHNPSNFSREGPRRDDVADVSDAELADFPVEEVSWDDAQRFLKKLSKRPEEKKAKRKYRLPTEAEWEYACRGGACTTTPFHYGTSLSSLQANVSGHEPYAAKKGPDLGRTSRVGSYLPNVFGLYDMHGNVWEWCEDWFGDHEASKATDPQGPSDGPGRVVHGGCWFFDAGRARAACRGWDSPDTRDEYNGFRVALGFSG